MKITSLLSFAVVALALGSVGCSASGRINVQKDPATKISTDQQLAYVTKPISARR